MPRRFFITGGTGLIGRALVRTLLREREALAIGHLTLLSRNPDRFIAIAPDIASARGVSLLQGDMTADNWPKETFTDIIHGATDINDLRVSDRLTYAWSIAEGTKRTLDYAASCGCERYLYLSSGAVYGPGPYPEAGIPEDWSTAPSLDSPATAYGQAKRFSEHLCNSLAHQTAIAVRIARIFSVIGPDSPLDDQYALGNFIRDAVCPRSKCIQIKGDGKAVRSYLHVEDLARWLVLLHEHGARTATLNFGSGRQVSLRELAEIISNVSEQKKPVVVEGQMETYAGRLRYYPDCHAAANALGIAESISLEDAIPSLLRAAASLTAGAAKD